MNKHEIFNAFDQKISLKSIVRRDDEYVIQGKFCVIAPTGKNRWNIWICNPDDLYSGLGIRKVRNICAELEKSEGCGAVRELTGEADVVVRGTAVILDNLRILGIRKKQTYSPETLAAMQDRMTAMRKEAA